MIRYGIIIIVIIVTSCGIDESGRMVNLLPDREMHIQLDKKTRMITHCLELVNDTLLYFQDDFEPSIHIYNINKGTLVNKIKLAISGPNNIIKPKGFIVCSPDSIYLGGSGYRLHLINSKGTVKRTYQFENIDSWPRIFTDQKALFLNDSILYVNCSPDFQPYVEKSPSLLLNIVTGEYKMTYGFPKKTYNKQGDWIWLAAMYSTMNKEGEVVVSFPADHNLYKTDLMDKSESYFSKSKYYESRNFVEPFGTGTSEYNMVKKDKDRHYYNAIIYDKYRDVYYRFALQKVENLIGEYPLFERPFSIIILDSKLEKIGETEIISGTKHVYWNYFVNKEGLWISTCNDMNPNIKEDLLSFQLYKFVE